VQKHDFKDTFKRLGIETFGCMLAAIGIYNFAVMAEFPLAGFTGIAVIINRFTDLPIGLTFMALNIPIALVCYRLLGRRFFLHSLFCMIVSSLMIDYLGPLFPAYHGSRLLAALACGVIAGIGYALMFTQQASSGGMGFIVMAIKSKRPHLSLGRLIFLADSIPIIAGGVLFRDIDGIIYALMISYIYALVADKLIYGANAGKLLLIVTDNATRIRHTIQEASGRGCTIWQATGGYQGSDREVVMCACDNTQTYKVQKAIETTDPAAFTIVLESNQVAGEGFTRLVLGEKE